MEDLLKMGGESLLVDSLVTLSSSSSKVPSSLLAASIVSVSTLYKNALSISDLSLCEKALNVLMDLSSSSDESLQRKSFFGINAIVSHFKPMAERFIEHSSRAVPRAARVVYGQCVLAGDAGSHERGMGVAIRVGGIVFQAAAVGKRRLGEK